MKRRVVLFEDDKSRAATVSTALDRVAAELECQVELFAPKERAKAETLSPFLAAQPHVTLVILDWDLSKYEQPVDRELVRGVCEELQIPLCVYSAKTGPEATTEERRGWTESQVRLPALDVAQLPGRICSLVRGFATIEDVIYAGNKTSLGVTLKKLLSAPDDSLSQIEQYAWGFVGLLKVASDKDVEVRSRFLVTRVGYWIANVLLPFPGLLLNGIAAASYLDVAQSAMDDAKVKSILSPAAYGGPFADGDQYWWAGALDKLVAQQMREDDKQIISGRESFRRQGLEFEPARCMQDHEGAGYYCIVNEKAVCAKHSIVPGGWLPAGADRCRIESNTFEELRAWLAI